MGVLRKQSPPNYPKNEHFLPPDTHTYVRLSGGKKCSFYWKFGMLYFLETPCLRFARLPYYWRVDIWYFHQSMTLSNVTLKGALLSHHYLKEKILKISALTFHSSKECCYFCCYILLFLYFYCYLMFLCFTQTGWNFFASQHTFTCLKTIEKLAKSMKYVQLTLKTPRRSRWRCSGVFSVDFENVLLLSLVFLLVTLNRQCFLVRDLSFRVKFFSEMLELVSKFVSLSITLDFLLKNIIWYIMIYTAA